MCDDVDLSGEMELPNEDGLLVCSIHNKDHSNLKILKNKIF